ncbi:serine/threonine-protein kinase [uncultured Deinococcus sp.]|uniref:serine/threonine-protein kinase n=1 Tax=uncultured Deinococcus sp. TaxID=158789 RepID=UPI0025FB220A|nr:serine/threonine-protein kinase [uncultured Deinococcus sp.]
MHCPTCAATVPDTALQCPSCGTPLGVQSLAPGTTLHGTYRIDAVLGQGGFGITYAATQLLLGARVAIKELFPTGAVRQGLTIRPPLGTAQDWAQARSDFIAEARILARFNHPDIVRVTDLFEAGNTAYMVMEYLEGESLQGRLDRQGALPPTEVQDIAQRVALALGLVHAAGLLHRDLKPDNVILERGGRVVLIDFGSARAFQSGQTVQHTRLVTPGYAPMEQYSSQAKYGPYTDLYALGATLHHALTGRMPPAAPDLLTGMTLPALPPGTPAGLRDAVSRAMAPRVADRPQSAPAFVALLDGAAPATLPAPVAPLPAPPPVPTPPPAPVPRRRVSPWPLIAVAALGFGLYQGVLAPSSTRAAPPRADVVPPAEPPVVVPASQSFAIMSPPAYTALPAGDFTLSGTGPAGDVVSVLEDGTSLGNVTIDAAGQWALEVPSPSAGAHEYSFIDGTGTVLGRVPLTVAGVLATVPADPITDTEVTALVDRYMAAGGGDDVGPALALYAEQVDYFKRGVQAREALYGDKHAYFVRWPERHYERTSDVVTLTEGDATRRVRFEYRYLVRNPQRQITGTAYTVLGVVRQGGSLLISGEDGAVYPETQVKTTFGAPTEPTLPVTGTAPKFSQWYFTTCQDDATSDVHTGLHLGRLQRCALVIETEPNGAAPVSATFSYELEYTEDGESVKKPIAVASRWPSGEEPAPAFETDGSRLTFTLPLTVKAREERTYRSINATGVIQFDNGATKTVYEKLPIE